jgi:hypothetical protein
VHVIRRLRSEERGLTLIEVSVGALIGVVVMLGLFAFLDTTSKSSQKTAARIDAAKLGRPVIASIMDRLHSTCVAPDLAPILQGSKDDSIWFLNQTGSAVTVTPLKRNISWSGDTTKTLNESIYPSTGGSAPDWTFSSSPSSTRIMLKPVQRVGTTPIFRYYAYGSTGTISTTPLPTPLSATDAAKVVQVTVSFQVPSRVDESDAAMAGTDFTDTALLRFTPPAADNSVDNLPCA